MRCDSLRFSLAICCLAAIVFCGSENAIAQAETQSTTDSSDVVGPTTVSGTDVIDATSVTDSIAFPRPAAVQIQTPGTLRFQFQESDWKDVIPWFAEQAGFSLQPITDWPTGTFYLKDDSEYTVMQALDQLNHALRMRNPPYTLIRNRKMLILAKLEDAQFPNDLIETVEVSQLDQRGKFETIICIFDLGELDSQKMFDELKPMVSAANKNYFAVFPAANQIYVRETGGTLRDIRDLIDAARKRQIGDQLELHVHRLKHVDAETFMMVTRGLLGIPAEKYATADNSLTITRETFGDRLFLRGTPAMLKRFADVAAVVDIPAEVVTGMEVVKQSFKTYPILVDPKLGFDLLQTVLEGTGARMQQDSITGSITVLGRPEDHAAVTAALTSIAEFSGEAFEILKIENGIAGDIMLAVQSLLGQTSLATTGSTGPVIMANSALNQILVRGTPQQVAEVKRMVLQLDANSIPTQNGPRTGTRIINMNPNKIDEISPMLEDLLNSTGRTNRLNVILPSERKDIKQRIRGLPAPRENTPAAPVEDSTQFQLRSNQNDFLSNTALITAVATLARGWLSPSSDSSYEKLATLIHRSLLIDAFVSLWEEVAQNQSFSQVLQPEYTFCSCPVPQIGQTTDEAPAFSPADFPTNGRFDEYTPPPQKPSVPGAPIEIRFTDYGVVLQSDDLDALDDLEQMLLLQIGEKSETQLPTFFFLNHRKADFMMGFLQKYFGMADSGADSGGGGGLMEGMMNNMLGGGAGDLLGGLLGGFGGSGGGSSSSAGVLEGQVRFGVDVAFNAIYVAGATANDLDQISELIEVLDQPEAPHDPDLVGQFRTILIIHRNPQEIKDLIAAQLSQYLDTGKSEGQSQNNETAQLAKMMQQLSGRGGRGGGNEESEQEKPKVRLDVDLTTNRLLVTGPEFIYNKIVLMVEELDRPELSKTSSMQVLQPQANTKSIKSTLEAMFGSKIEYKLENETDPAKSATAASSTSASSSPAASNRANQAAQRQQEQARAAMINAIRQQQGGGQGGGRGNTGGGTRGGAASGGGRGGR